METYRFSKVIKAHDDNIREILLFVDALGSQRVVSASRDTVAKVFKVENGIIDSTEEHSFYLPSPISSVAIASNQNQNTPSYIFGCLDAKIYIYTSYEALPMTLAKHTQNVCILKVDSQLSTTRIASGSWDKFVYVYDDKFKVLFQLTSHTETVNDIMFIGSNSLLTASSDKSIIFWDISNPVVGAIQQRTFMGHEDCVRGLAQFPNEPEIFYSISNDQTVRSWELTTGNSLRIYAGHSHFIYKIIILDSFRHFITCGEDKNVCVWSKDLCEPLAKILLPVVSIWSLVALNSGTFLASGSDGRIYVFSNQTELQANSKEQVTFNDLIAKQNIIALETVQHLKLYEEDSLKTVPPKNDGEKRLVRSIEDNSVVVYQFHDLETKWKPIGHVSDYVHREEVDTFGRVFFNGRYYDEVLNVKLNKKLFKLPFNRNQDPWTVATYFLDEFKLEPELLPQIVRSIVTYASYKPKKESSQGYFPIWEFKFFTQLADLAKLKAKFMEFNQQQTSQELQLTNNQIEIITSKLDDPTGNCETIVEAYKKLLHWPANKFIVYDLLRMFLTNKYFNTFLIHNFTDLSVDFGSLVTVAENEMPLQLTSFRVLCNMFGSVHGAEFMYNNVATVTAKLLNWNHLVSNLNVHLAYSSIWFNYSVLLIDYNKRQDNAFASRIMAKVLESFDQSTFDKAVLQTLYTFGNLLAAGVKSDSSKKFLNQIQQTYPTKFKDSDDIRNCLHSIERMTNANY